MRSNILVRELSPEGKLVSFTAYVMPVGTPTINRHIYSKEVVESALKNVENLPIPVMFDKEIETCRFKPDRWVATLNKADIVDNNLWCEFAVLRTPLAQTLTGMDFRIDSCFLGYINNGVVEEGSRLLGFSITSCGNKKGE